MDVDAAWAVVAGVAVAVAGPFVTGFFERKARRDERQENDQRATLHAVQDDMYRMLIAAGTYSGMNVEHDWTKEADQPFDTPEAKEARKLARERGASLVRYTERIRDDRAREALTEYYKAASKMLNATGASRAIAAYADARELYDVAQAAVGKALRKL